MSCLAPRTPRPLSRPSPGSRRGRVGLGQSRPHPGRAALRIIVMTPLPTTVSEPLPSACYCCVLSTYWQPGLRMQCTAQEQPRAASVSPSTTGADAGSLPWHGRLGWAGLGRAGQRSRGRCPARPRALWPLPGWAASSPLEPARPAWMATRLGTGGHAVGRSPAWAASRRAPGLGHRPSSGTGAHTDSAGSSAGMAPRCLPEKGDVS